MSSSHSDSRRAALGLREYLTFFIAQVEYAVSLDYVREVIPYDTVTRVPGMPETVRGVTNLRGSVVPVIDLALKFGLSRTEVTARSCIVLVETPLGGNLMRLGLLTEEVGQVLGIARTDLLAPPSFGMPVHTDYLQGMLPMGKKFALALDIARVLSQDEILASSDASPELEREADAASAGAVVAVDDEAWEDEAEASSTPATSESRVDE